MRSGWNSSSWSSFSPTDANMIGTPVTARTDSAAPPRASPSSFVITMPSNSHLLAERLGHVDGVLAGHGVEHEQRRVGLHRVADPHQLVHQVVVDVQAAGGVDDHRVAALLARLLHAPGRDLDRIDVGAAVEHRHADLARRPSSAARWRPAGRRRTPPARACGPASRAASRACRWSSSCRSPAGRPSGSRDGLERNASFAAPVPIRAASSSLTILMTCWPGFRPVSTPSPTARSRTLATNSRTTLKLTSASSSARRISRIAAATSSSDSRPRDRRSVRVVFRRSERESNTCQTIVARRGAPARSVGRAGASRTAGGIAGHGGAMFKIPRAGAVAITESPREAGL